MSAVVNSNVTFRCRRTSHIDVIRWTYYRHTVVDSTEIFNGYRLAEHYQTSGRYGARCDEVTDECTLTICTVQIRDRGMYTCSLSGHQKTFWLLVVGTVYGLVL